MHSFRLVPDTDAHWRRHENPVSVWWLVLLYPVFVLAVYRRSRALGGLVLLSLAANLTVVSPPETDDAWATRVVRGEQLWIARGLCSSRRDLLVTAAGGVVNVYTLRAAVQQRRARTLVGTAASMAVTFYFFGRMADRYEAERDARQEDPTQ